ncbi:hypothetical protein GPROT1_00326, partial [Gammaproteobacteria bacterium]
DPLPALPIQYADYATWQRRWLDGEVLQAQSAYWQQTLAGAPVLLELPTDRARPAQQDHAGAAVGFELDAGLSERLKALSQRHGTTLFMTLLAGWAVLLARLSGQSDVVIGTPVANRQRPEVQPLIGFFVNTLALRVQLTGETTVAHLLQQVRERALQAQQHQDLPFEQVVELVKPPRSLAHSPLFQVLFSWHGGAAGQGEGALELPGLRSTSLQASHTTAQFDLALNLMDTGERIAGGVEYATALFDPATVRGWLDSLRTLLEAMVCDDAQPVDRLALLTAAERQRLLHDFNATEAAYPSHLCVHELIEAQAARTPDLPAVADDEATLGYAELNARANRLAHHLRSLGVRPDDRVGLCLERSTDMLVAVLAVMKAGAAYVPLDPAHPAQRLAELCEDSEPVAVLTHNR